MKLLNFNWKQHKVEIALGVFAVIIIWYLHRKGAFYGEGVMPAGGKMGDMMVPMGLEVCMGMPMMDKKKFEDCLNAGVNVADCSACFGGGDKKTSGGIVDVANLEDCLNENKTSAECIMRSTFGMGRAGVMMK